MNALKLTETVKTRIDAVTKRQLEREAVRTERSESDVVRLALRDYLKRKGSK